MSRALQSAPPNNQESLVQAFSVFNELSEQLTSAYGQLESQVAGLNAELATSRKDRSQERAQKEHLADRLSSLLETLPAAVVLVDGRDRIDRFNPAAEQLFPELAWGRIWSEIVTESVVGEAGHDDWLLADGQRINVIQRALSDHGRILVMVDVTETRAMEERLERQDRLSAMGEMAAQLAHQVRTPLSTAVLYAGQLSKSTLNEQQREAFSAKLLAGLRHTEQLVSDMLAFSRGGSFMPQPVILCQMIEIAIDALAPKIAHQKVDFQFSCLVKQGTQILGNKDALSGALSNLLENALDHGFEAMQIRLVVEQIKDRIVITLSDNGSGVSNDVKQHIFDPFFTTRERGTGLGLAVVQTVVLEHHGSITVDDSSIGGAEFTVTLPCFETAQQHWGIDL